MEFKSQNAVMREVLRQAIVAARHAQAILLLGETGTGKDELARYIHEQSDRADKPFITLNCAALNSDLWESEVFGYARGAFTGADPKGKPGKFELAGGGTIFLDEIAELSPNLQAKLLRLIQHKVFERVGSNETIQVDVLVIAATNKSLDELQDPAKFRQDLFYRLNEFRLHLPPLRERKEDLEALVKYFIAQKGALGITDKAFFALTLYDWPGNIRELERAISRGAAFADGKAPIDLTHLPPEVAKGIPDDPPAPLLHAMPGSLYARYMHMAERILLLKALEACGYRGTVTCKYLGIARATLYKKLNAHPDLKEQVMAKNRLSRV